MNKIIFFLLPVLAIAVGVVIGAEMPSEQPVRQVVQTDSMVMISIVSAIAEVLVVLIGALLAFFIAVVNKKATGIVKTVNDTHALVNSDMVAVLLVVKEYAEDRARKEPTAVNLEAARIAREKYEHRVKQQAIMNALSSAPDGALEAAHKAAVLETRSDVKVVKEDVQDVKSELKKDVKDAAAVARRDVKELKEEVEAKPKGKK